MTQNYFSFSVKMLGSKNNRFDNTLVSAVLHVQWFHSSGWVNCQRMAQNGCTGMFPQLDQRHWRYGPWPIQKKKPRGATPRGSWHRELSSIEVCGEITFFPVKSAPYQKTLGQRISWHLLYLDLTERSWIEILGEGGEIAVLGQGVDKVDVPVPKPVEAEYEELIASSTDALPFRNILKNKRRDRVTLTIIIIIDHAVRVDLYTVHLDAMTSTRLPAGSSRVSNLYVKKR